MQTQESLFRSVGAPFGGCPRLFPLPWPRLPHSAFCIHHQKSSYAPPPINDRTEVNVFIVGPLLCSTSHCLNFHSNTHYRYNPVSLRKELELRILSKHTSSKRHKINVPSFLHKVRSITISVTPANRLPPTPHSRYSLPRRTSTNNQSTRRSLIEEEALRHRIGPVPLSFSRFYIPVLHIP